ncbi:hypothetical protein [Bacillus halotolerans]|uniref:hypothetical protein n=1 Tax=Bacillus halotolerans TaxID=260554 RepID=UPI0003A4EFE5|nr:hypothetical protein [Bacillus halotolerans]MDG3074747.1 hypothetical protein [Bacillus halotolerans]PLR91544.1 hypothetical protein CTZ29_09845 [Bacillus halotolerans]UYO33257.1 hypothetical protein NDR85_06735 [Bacillus halotolerans]
MKLKIFSSVMSVALVSSLTLPSFASAKTAEPEVSKGCNQPLTEEEFTEKYGTPTDLSEDNTDLDLAFEIANSDLEEKAIVNNKGLAENYYKNAKEANVSEKAYNEFNAVLKNLNDGINSGQYTLGENISDIHFAESSGDVSQKGSWYISHSKASKATKLIAAGAGVALLASELGVPVLVASGLAALSAGVGLCDWNDKGFYIMYIGNVWTCVPKV